MDLRRATLQALDWPLMLAALAEHARTPRGRREALELKLLDDAAAIDRLFDQVTEACLLRDGDCGRLPVGGVEDVALDIRRAGRGEQLEQETLHRIALTVAALDGLDLFLERSRALAPSLADRGADLAVDRALCKMLGAAFDGRGALSEKTYPKLGELRGRILALQRRMRATLDALIVGDELAGVLQDRYVTIRGDRFVVPIKAQAKHLDLGIVHDASRSGQTVYVEPRQVIPLGNEQRLLEAELQEEIRRILAELSAAVGRHAAHIELALAVAAEMDLIGARADLAARLDAVRPRVGCEGVVELRQVRHPVLALSGIDVVANDLRLDASSPILVLTGPNAGGKTVALKTVGLCALLVRCGCFVPAAGGSRIDLFAEILADIGDQQTVVDGLSSFSGHLRTLRGMLEDAGDAALLLLDEIAAGTDPAQGGALARALLERFATLGARVVATTHYAQVKAMASADRRVRVAAMEYRDERPTYRVIAGLAGESHALGAALRLGIDASVVARARDLMDEGERALHDALAELEAEREQSSRLTRAAEQAGRDLAERERDLARREERIRLHARRMEEEAAAAFLERVRQAERRIAEITAELQKAPTSRAADEARLRVRSERGILETESATHRAGPPVGEVGGADVGRPLVVGDRVRVAGLELVAEVVAVRAREIEVRAGSISLRVRPQDAVRAGVGGGPVADLAPSARRTRSAGGPAAAVGTSGHVRLGANTLDLRGLRVEAGLEALDRFLDEAVLRGHDAVFVLHGHGTGAMKTAVREHLTDSPYAAAWDSADPEQGGDALTVVVLRS